jgi:hypothetical protein
VRRESVEAEDSLGIVVVVGSGERGGLLLDYFIHLRTYRRGGAVNYFDRIPNHSARQKGVKVFCRFSK